MQKRSRRWHPPWSLRLILPIHQQPRCSYKKTYFPQCKLRRRTLKKHWRWVNQIFCHWMAICKMPHNHYLINLWKGTSTTIGPNKGNEMDFLNKDDQIVDFPFKKPKKSKLVVAKKVSITKNTQTTGSNKICSKFKWDSCG